MITRTSFRGSRIFLVYSIKFYSVSFLSKLIRTASKRPLELSDLGESSKNVKPAKLYSAFEKEWAKECKKEPKKRSLLSAILRANALYYWAAAILINLINTAISFIPTMILNLFVKDVEEGIDGIHFLLFYSFFR